MKKNKTRVKKQTKPTWWRSASKIKRMSIVAGPLAMLIFIGLMMIGAVIDNDDCLWVESLNQRKLEQKMALLPLDKRFELALQINKLGLEELSKGIEGARNRIEQGSASQPRLSFEKRKKELCTEVRKIVEPIYNW